MKTAFRGRVSVGSVFFRRARVLLAAAAVGFGPLCPAARPAEAMPTAVATGPEDAPPAVLGNADTTALTVVLQIQGGRAEILRKHAVYARRRVERLLVADDIVVRVAPRRIDRDLADAELGALGREWGLDALLLGAITVDDSGWTLLVSVRSAYDGTLIGAQPFRGKRFVDVAAALQGAEGQQLLELVGDARGRAGLATRGSGAELLIVEPPDTSAASPALTGAGPPDSGAPGANAGSNSPEQSQRVDQWQRPAYWTAPIFLSPKPAPAADHSAEDTVAAGESVPSGAHQGPGAAALSLTPTVSAPLDQESSTRELFSVNTALPPRVAARLGPVTTFRRWVVRSPPRTLFDGELSREHEVPLIGGHAQLALFPFPRDSIWTRLGVEGAYGQAIGRTGFDGRTYTTRSGKAAYSLAWTLPGERFRATVRCGLAHQWLSIGAPQSVTFQPNIAYTMATAGVSAELKFAERVWADVGAAFLPLLGTGGREGQLQNERWFPKTSGFGWTAEVGLSVWLGSRFGVRLGGGIAQYELNFELGGTRDAGTTVLILPRAEGARDTYATGTLAALVRLN